MFKEFNIIHAYTLEASFYGTEPPAPETESESENEGEDETQSETKELLHIGQSTVDLVDTSPKLKLIEVTDFTETTDLLQETLKESSTTKAEPKSETKPKKEKR